MRHMLAIFCLIATFSVAAEEPSDSAQPEAPTLPPTVQSGESLEPEITIIRRDKRIVHEYRINGALYMVKIIPNSGPAYYLVDSNGDGEMETRRSDLSRNMNVPQWLIYSW